jgi:ABC-type Fe3+ transport system substrate-binding protein
VKEFVMINADQSVARILTETPTAREFFSIKRLPADPGHRMAAQLSLKNMLRFKKIDERIFLRELDAFIAGQEQVLHEGAEAENCHIWARIPCVVQLPVQHILEEYLDQNHLKLRYNIALVEFGRDWIDDLTRIARPPVLIGAGIEGMVQNQAVMGEYAAPALPYNDDFKGLEDPRGIFHILSGVPLIFVVDRSRLGTAPPPRSWEALLSGDYTICYADDGHMLDGVLLAYIYKYFGEEGLRAFKERSLRGAHPSQMIKAGGIEERPQVYVLPHIFASIKVKEPGFEILWPEEGALLIPVLLTVRKDAGEEEKKAAEFLCGPRCGQAFATQGMFPASSPGARNNLPGKLWWLGWDYIYQNNLLEIIGRSKKIFQESRG